jgi:ATP phosphoribosyltransferase
MSEGLILAIPSKGRLKDQAEAWLADCGLPLASGVAARGYQGRLEAMPEIRVRLAPAADIAAALIAGEIHLGVTGEDLLRESSEPSAAGVALLAPLGFGRADVVVAVPRSWLDVGGMADLEEIAHLFLARTGGRLRVASKYPNLSRAFFARHGLTEYRLIDSTGATEAAPAAGAAEIIVDITSSGATLAANGLRALEDGLILKSEAVLAATARASWSEDAIWAARRLIRIVEGRAAGLAHARLAWPADRSEAAAVALAGLAEAERSEATVASEKVFAACESLVAAGVAPLRVSRSDFLFRADGPWLAAFESAARLLTRSASSGGEAKRL